jgi:hypothetical protein
VSEITDVFQSLLSAQIAKAAQGRGQITLGGLIDALALAPKDALVRFADGASTKGFDSYRGYYEQLALSAGNEDVTAGKLLDLCRETDGQTMQGYKGGDFLMGRGTYLNRAEYSYCGNPIVGIELRDGVLVLIEGRPDV